MNRKKVWQDNGHGLTMVILLVTFPRGDIMGDFFFLLYILLGCLNSQKKKKKKENWNLGCCISRQHQLLNEMPPYCVINRECRTGALCLLQNPPSLLTNAREHGGQSQKQGELESRNIFYSWESYIRRN